MIKAVIFDMDGLLIDSEPFWQETEQKVMENYGIRIDESLQKNTFGLSTIEQIKFWYDFQPWENPDFKKIEKEYDSIIIDFFKTKAMLFDGVFEIIDFFKSRDLPIALASSSRMSLINAFLDTFNFRETFDFVHSAEYEEYGKPHPAVYLKTSEMLNVSSHNCLAFEDSLNGVIAAKAAKMKVVAIPDPKHFEDPGYGIADLILCSLLDFQEKELDQINKL
jgi:beta-phosphoglucomutase-like phosphatase (HAD superfamily)